MTNPANPSEGFSPGPDGGIVRRGRNRVDNRRRSGVALLVAGIALIAVGAIGMLGAGSTSTDGAPSEAAASAAPSVAASASVAPTAPIATPSSAPTAPPVPTATPAPPSPTPDPRTLIAAFYEGLDPAIRAADADTLVPLLHPATIERYGEPACRTYLGGLADPTLDIEVASVTGPDPWDYVTDDLTTTIPDTWTVQAAFTSQGTTSDRELHVALVNGEVRWFTDCGTPLAP